MLLANYEGNPPVISWFPSQKASGHNDAETISIW